MTGIMPSDHCDLNKSEAGPVTADEDFNKTELSKEESQHFPKKKSSVVSSSGSKGPGVEEKKKDSPPQKANTPKSAGAIPKSKITKGTMSPRQETLSREISKLQDLMLSTEASYEDIIQSRTDEVEELRGKLARLEAGGGRRLVEVERRAVELANKLEESKALKAQLVMIMEEYEKTIAQMVTKREEEMKEFEVEKERIARERDMALSHLSNLELAFNDIHQKYERCKGVIEAFRKNEEEYKRALVENERTIRTQEDNYFQLKNHASEKLEEANAELDRLRSSHEKEMARMTAMNRKAELRLQSLEESVEQKKREVEELAKICDELITRVEEDK